MKPGAGHNSCLSISLRSPTKIVVFAIIVEKKLQVKSLGESDRQAILRSLVETPLTIEGLVKQLQPENEKTLLELIRQMLDQGELSYDTLGRIQLSRQNV